MSEPGSFKTDLLAAIPSLRAFAMSLAQNSDKADDLVQETLVKSWDKQASFTPGTNLKAWLFTILRNCFISERRKKRHEVEDGDGHLAASVGVAGAQASHMDLLDFAKAFEALPDDQREALILIGAEGFAYEEAAQMCGCAVGTMKSRVNRARTRLSTMLEVKEPAIAGDDGKGK